MSRDPVDLLCESYALGESTLERLEENLDAWFRGLPIPHPPVAMVLQERWPSLLGGWTT